MEVVFVIVDGWVGNVWVWCESGYEVVAFDNFVGLRCK